MKKTIVFFLFLNIFIINEAQVPKMAILDLDNKGKFKVAQSNNPIKAELVNTEVKNSNIQRSVIAPIVTVTSNVYIEKAGTLSSVLTKPGISNITNLTITGKIDARDFKTLDNMPVLSVLNIKSVNITAYTGSETSYNVNMEYIAKTIPPYSFENCTNLKSIILPDSLKMINSKAFFCCEGLTSIILPPSLEVIGFFVFEGCTRLSTITIPPSVTNIGYGLLKSWNNPMTMSNIVVNSANRYYSSLDGVLFDKYKIFLIKYPCTKTGRYSIPSTVTIINHYAFEDCINLIEISIPSSVTTIGGYAFYNCNSLTRIYLPSSLTSIYDGAFQFCSKLTGTLTIPSGVTAIGNYTFWGCDLTSVIIHDKVTSIGILAFCSNDKLTTITIPVSVEYLGKEAFSCDLLASVYVNSSIPINIDNYVFSLHSNLYVPYATKALYSTANEWGIFTNIIEDTNGFSINTKSVKLKATAGSDLTVNVKANMLWTSKSDQAWLNINPTSGKSNTTLNLTATGNPTIACRNAVVTISANGKESQKIAVMQEGALRAVNNTAGNLSLNFNSDELKTIYNLVITGTIDARDFRIIRDSMPMLTMLNLSNVIIDEYSGKGGTIGTGIYKKNEIPEFAFYNSGNNVGKTLTSIILPNSITSIGRRSFNSCSGLKKLLIPRSVNSIDSLALIDCAALILVDDNNVNYSSLNGVLYNKERTNLIHCPISLTGEFEFPSSVKKICDYAFYNCTGLTGTLIMPESIESIGFSAFYSCYGFTGILSIPNLVTTIRNLAFYNCQGFSSLFIPSSVSSIGDFAFGICKEINSIYTNLDKPIDLSSSALVFNNIDTTSCILYVPIGSKGYYKVSPQWKVFKIIEIALVSSNTNISIGADENSAVQFLLTTNGKWTAYSNQEWLTISPNSGNNSTPLLITARKNPYKTLRTAIVTIILSDFSLTFSITQTGYIPTLSVSSKSLILSPNKSNNITLNVYSNVPWVASSDKSWLKVSPVSSSRNDKITLIVDANPVTVSRSAKIIISGEGVTAQTITVTQDAPFISVSTATENFDANYNDVKVNIVSNITWSVSTNQSWLTFSPTSGSGFVTLTIKAEGNSSFLPRTAIITIAGMGLSVQTVVNQATFFVLPVTIISKWNDVLICNNELKQFISYQWYKDDIAIIDATQQYYYQPGGLNGNYYVITFNADGEKGISNTIVVSKQLYSKYINAFPNPIIVNKEITLKVNLSEKEMNDSKIVIYSTKGVKIKSIEDLNDNMTFQFNAQGIYILQLQSKEGIIKETTKIIVFP